MEEGEESKRGGDALAQPATRLTGALVLILLGVFFLLNQYGILKLEGNWWAIFIALPALAMLYSAYTAYHRAGTMTAEVTASLSGAVIVGLIAVLAALNQFELLFPLLLIVLGVFVALGWRQPRRQRRQH